MYIGNIDGKLCWVSQSSPNRSVCVTGISGMGKTTRLNYMELLNAKAGAIVLVLDMNQTHTEEQVFPCIREEYLKYANRIHALRDGLGLGLLQPMYAPDGTEEPFFHLVNSAVKALSSAQNMGVRQIGTLRNAVINAIRYRGSFQTEAEALAISLLQQEDSCSEAVYQKLWTLLNCGALKSASKCIGKGKINMIDLSGADSATQNCLAEIFLSNLWRNVQFNGMAAMGRELVIVLDEFQNLSLKHDAVLRDMLREGRKFGLNLILATQTLEAFPKETLALLNQTATRLFFRPAPSEAKRIAKEIDFENPNGWVKTLLGLRIGESVAVGNFCIEGAEICRPLILG